MLAARGSRCAPLRCKRPPAAVLVRQQRARLEGQGAGQCVPRRCGLASGAARGQGGERRGVGSLRSELYRLQKARARGPGRRVPQPRADRALADVALALPAAAASADSLKELTDVCRLLAQAQPSRRLDSQEWKGAALDRTLELLRVPTAELEPRTLASLAHTLTRLQVQFTERDTALVDLLGQHIAASAEDALAHRDTIRVSARWDQQSVATAMQALAKLSVRHDPALCALAGLVPQLEPSLTPRSTASILWALATLNCAEEPYREAVVQLSQRLTSNVSGGGEDWTEARTVITAVWSLTVLDKLSAPVVRALFAVLTAAEKRGSFKGKENIPLLCQLHQVFLAVELGHLVGPQQKKLGASHLAGRGRQQPRRPSAIKIPDRWVARSRKAWWGTNTAVPRSSPHSPGAAEVERALALARPEAQVKREQLLPDCGYSVDILLPDQKVVVEYDGLVHYCRRGPWEEVHTDGLGAEQRQRKLGRTALKQRQIEAMGWRMVSVAWWEWEALREEGNGAEVRWLARETRGGQGAGGDAEARSGGSDGAG